MYHNFDTELAKKYGLEEAILLENLGFWIKKNKANKRHCYEGYYWTYNTVSAFQELFPYLTKARISRALKKLENIGIIKSANFNENQYNRTKWYAIIDIDTLKKFGIDFVNSENQLLKQENHFLKSEIINTDKLPYSKPDIKKENIYIKENDLKNKNAINKTEIEAKEILDYLNDRCSTKFQFQGATKINILARLKEYEKQEIISMIEFKIKEWINTDYRKYLRPITLFRFSNCENYINQMKIESNKSKISEYKPIKISGYATEQEIINKIDIEYNGQIWQATDTDKLLIAINQDRFCCLWKEYKK